MSKDNPHINSGWVENENFAEFFREYIKDDIYKSDADENLKIFITYRSLYTIYVNAQKAQDNIKALDEKLSSVSDYMIQVNEGLVQLMKLMVMQEKINKTIRFQAKLLLIGVTSLLLIFGYTIFKILFY